MQPHLIEEDPGLGVVVDVAIADQDVPVIRDHMDPMPAALHLHAAQRRLPGIGDLHPIRLGVLAGDLQIEKHRHALGIGDFPGGLLRRRAAAVRAGKAHRRPRPRHQQARGAPRAAHRSSPPVEAHLQGARQPVGARRQAQLARGLIKGALQRRSVIGDAIAAHAVSR